MARVCKICTHAEREHIEAAIEAGESIRHLSSLYGISEASLRRHQKNHMGTDAAPAGDVTQSERWVVYRTRAVRSPVWSTQRSGYRRFDARGRLSSGDGVTTRYQVQLVIAEVPAEVEVTWPILASGGHRFDSTTDRLSRLSEQTPAELLEAIDNGGHEQISWADLTAWARST